MGIVLFELLTHEVPWQKTSPELLFEHVAAGKRPPIPAACQAEAPAWCRLLTWCWAQHPKDRPTFPQIWEQIELLPLPEMLHSDSRHRSGDEKYAGGADTGLEMYVLLE